MTAKKPAAIRKLEGNPGKRRIPDNELVGIGQPEPPAHLTAEQLARWHDVVASLPPGLLSMADTQVLERMAVAWAAFRQACGLINQSGPLMRGQHGELVYSPLLRVRTAAAEEMQQCGLALGLSPLARTRLTSPEQQDADPLTILLGPNGSGRVPN